MAFEKNKYKKKVSLIIGCHYRDIKACRNLINKLRDNQFFIKEIILIFNYIDKEYKFNEIANLKFPDGLCNCYFYKDTLFPGAARNEGISKSSAEYLAFLDSSTVPENNWLKKSLTSLSRNKKDGILGKTIYTYKNSFEKCFIAATYGGKKLDTVPGSLFRKKLINKIGYFLPNLRSGEDSEWIKRASEIESKLIADDSGVISYIGIVDKSFIYLCKKWFLYYSSLAQNYNVEIERQRFTYIAFFAFSTFVVTFFWNDIIADWNEKSFLYVNNITKIALFLIFSAYSLLRFIVMPKRKKINLLKFNLLEIIIFIKVSIFLDFIKLLAFVKTIIYRD